MSANQDGTREYSQEARSTTDTPRWMQTVLRVAGVYNLAWGAFVVIFPLAAFRWANMAPPNYPEIWQCVGMIVGVYGVGYLIAARDPLRHWPIVLVGLLGKIFGPLGMLNAIFQGRFPPVAALLCLFNDIVWWIPFALILHRAHQTQNLKELQ